MRILIADDSAPVIELLRMQLLKQFETLNEPVEIITASTVTEAIAKHEGCDVVLLDLQMPPHNAEETAKLIPSFWPVPVVVVSGHKTPKIMRTVMEDHGAESYLFKGKAIEEPRILMLRITEAIWRRRYQLKRGSK